MPLAATDKRADSESAAVNLEGEIEALQRHLEGLASHADEDLVGRYRMRRPPMPQGLYWQLRWIAGWFLSWLKSLRIWQPNPWPAALRRTGANTRAKPLVIWAVGTDRDTLRAACKGFKRMQDVLPEFAPVLITDVADFAFFSRLGWLVEYLPRLRGEGEPYEERKARFLARLYRGAPALPVAVGLEGRPASDIRSLVHSLLQVNRPLGRA